jgi:hypothetical protein
MLALEPEPQPATSSEEEARERSHTGSLPKYLDTIEDNIIEDIGPLL